MRKIEEANVRRKTSATQRSASVSSGFTLLELLVSMVILMVIVLSTTKIFNASTVAWDTGSRKAEVNMTGRSVADFLAQEISQAVYDGSTISESSLLQQLPAYPGPLSLMVPGNVLRFATLERDPSSAARAARIVEYTVSNGVVLVRSSRGWSAGSVYSNVNWATSSASPESTQVELSQDISGIEFYRDRYSSVGSMPLYVDVRVSVSRPEDVAKGYSTVYSNLVFESRGYLVNRNRYRYE